MQNRVRKASSIADCKQLLWVGCRTASTHLFWVAEIELKQFVFGADYSIASCRSGRGSLINRTHVFIPQFKLCAI
ncbi:Uncharacterised protein [Vibrio cholerae]|nr:Uncharacterised protein [Vibrio cholerae]